MPYNSWGDDGINSRQLQLLITFSTIQPSSLSLLLMFLLSIHWFGRILYLWSREDGSLTPNFIPFVIGHLNFQLFKNLSLYRAAAKRWECAEPRYHYNCHPTKGENLSLSLSHPPPASGFLEHSTNPQIIWFYIKMWGCEWPQPPGTQVEALLSHTFFTCMVKTMAVPLISVSLPSAKKNSHFNGALDSPNQL